MEISFVNWNDQLAGSVPGKFSDGVETGGVASSAGALPLLPMLRRAEREQYALGSFSCRYGAPMMRAVLSAAERLRSPVIIQVSQRETAWFEIDLSDFAGQVRLATEQLGISVPVALHLDHSFDLDILRRAIDAGFTSVMYDGSKHPLEQNIAETAAAVKLAHASGVTLEGEIGKIGGADKLETDDVDSTMSDPDEVRRFVEGTGCDYVAVSVGTAHGFYTTADPKIDFERLEAIRAVVSIPLVLHGGSGLPDKTIHRAIRIAGGGISKVNIATELEHAFCQSIGEAGRMSPEAIRSVDPARSAIAEAAVEQLAADRIENYLLSAGRV